MPDNDTYILLNKNLRDFEERINNCMDDASLSQILEDFSEHLSHTELIDITEYKYINELIKSKRKELSSISENSSFGNNSKSGKILTYTSGFNHNSVNHSAYNDDNTPTTAASGNRGLVANILLISSGVIATVIMYILLVIGLIKR